MKRETLESRGNLTDLQGFPCPACGLGPLPIPASPRAERFLLQNPHHASPPLALLPARGEIPQNVSQVLRGETKKTPLSSSCPRPAAPCISYSGPPQAVPIHLPTPGSRHPPSRLAEPPGQASASPAARPPSPPTLGSPPPLAPARGKAMAGLW